MAEAELLELFEKASKAAGKAFVNGGVVDAEEARCTDALKAIGDVNISTSLLLSTQVGKRLRKLANHTSLKISTSAQEILEEWKKVVSGESCCNSKTTKKTSVSNSVTLPHQQPDVSAPEPQTTIHKKSTKVTQIKVEVIKVMKVESKTVTNSITKAGLENHAAHGPPVAPIPSTSIMEFVTQIGAVPKAGGDGSRDRIRELMVEALSKVCNEAKDSDLEKARNTDIVEVAVAVENALFSKLGLSRGKEKAKYRFMTSPHVYIDIKSVTTREAVTWNFEKRLAYKGLLLPHRRNKVRRLVYLDALVAQLRSIMFNIKDDKNPDFRRRVLLGKIKPEAIVTMTSDDMASDQRKKETEDIKAKAMFECERGMQHTASTDQFKCAKCGQRKTTYFQMQTRSADEPMTTFVTCMNCNAHWKFC